MNKPVEMSIVRGDVSEIESDMLLLKYARRFHGADESVMVRLEQLGLARESEIDPHIGEPIDVVTDGTMSPARVLFLGTQSLRDFRYKEMRAFACRAIEVIDQSGWPVGTMTVTVHGAGYGLDIEESLHAMVFGFQQAIARGLAPDLDRIVFVERNTRRFDLLKSALNEMPHLTRPNNPAAVKNSGDTKLTSDQPVADSCLPENPEKKSDEEPEKKKLAFVAMPFAQEFDDVYQFGIYGTVRRCGYVCERIDESFYAGNMVDRIMEGIRRAEFVIADLTAERPNVYLEVGYAWGLNRPVILVAREGERLHFDLSHHKCIFYPTIGKLADQLEMTIRDLFGVKGAGISASGDGERHDRPGKSYGH